MIQVIRHCPDCGRDRLVEQYHPPGACPDSADGECPEWYCTECGTALLTGLAFGRDDAAEAPELRDRVA
jgi:hypothetical protein